MNKQQKNYASGMRIVIRDAEWVIRRVDSSADGGHQLVCEGISELVRGKEGRFLTELMRVDDSTRTIKNYAPLTTNYDYDAAGNILVKGDYGGQYRYGSVGKGAGGNAGPNAIRQFIRGGTKTFTYDNNGNRLTGDGVTLTYNDQKKPLTVDRNNVKSTFSYDANGRLRYSETPIVNNIKPVS